MSIMPVYFAIGLPCLTVPASLIVSLFQTAGVREDTGEIRTDTKLLTGKVHEMMEHKP